MASRDVAIDVYIDEEVARPGYARIIVANARAAGEEARFRLQRLDREQNTYLGPKGWQSGAADLTPWKADADGLDLVLFVGPEVVDAVPNDIPVEISVVGADVHGVVYWPDLPTSSVASGQDFGATPVRPAPPPRPEPEPSPQTPELPPEPPPAEDAETVAPEPVVPPQPMPPGPTPGLAPTPPPAPERPPWLFGLAGLVFAALLGAAAYWHLSRPSVPDPVVVVNGENGGGQVEPRPEGPSCEDYAEYARAVVEANPEDADALFTEAKQLLDGACRDAGVALLIQARNVGSAQAKLLIARLVDPLVEHDDRIFAEEPDPAYALQLYAEAAAAGLPDAATARGRLIDHLRARAAEGDAAARDLVDSIE